MPAYNYRAVDDSGRVARGRVAAANEIELAQNLNHMGLELIDARMKREATQPRPRLPQRFAPEALARFCTQMTDLLRAGIPFSEALQELMRSTPAGTLRDALNDINRAIEHGGKISDGFARHTRLFPNVFIAILAAGESGGDLAVTFLHLARYAEARARTLGQLRRAVRYPLFLLLVTVGVITFMMTMVIPPVIQMLNNIDSEMPIMTRILVTASDLFVGYWWALLIAIGTAVVGLYVARRTSEKAARALDALTLKLPMLGPALHKLALARFAHSFAILFQSGVGVPDSLRGAGATLGNRALVAQLEDAGRQVQAGRSLSAAMMGLFPPFAAHMMRIGERSGKLGKALDDIATICDRDATETTNKLIGAMEPALTLTVGSILAWIVMAVLGPIYGNLTKISGMM